MNNAIKYFDQQKLQALNILKKLVEFVREGDQLGINMHPDLVQKVLNGLDEVQDEKLRVALIGGFSEGKTSIAAAWMEKLDKTSMKISHQESSNEVKIYDVEDKLQLIDTPGLFGFKEQVNTDTMAIEKYKDITKHYVSEAHLVLYVMNSTNSIKQSHADDLNWLFRSLNLLPRTVFVLSRFDEVADVADEVDYLEKFLVKKSSVAQRLDEMLHLSTDEKASLSIVAVAANPFDLGTEHWLTNLEQFKSLSHIDKLQDATRVKIQQSGGVLALANEVKKSIISDIIQKQLPLAQEGFETLKNESQRMNSMLNDQKHELSKVSKKISDARVNLRGRIVRYFEDLLLQCKGVSPETFNEFLHREIGTEGGLINQRVQEIFSDEVKSIAQDLDRIQVKIDSEFVQFHNVALAMGKKGLDFLNKSNVINNQNVLMVRNGLSTASKALGMDLGGMLKFKPWGATKLANGISGALSVLGLALEVWDSWKQEEQKLQFQQAMVKMQNNLSSQSKEIVDLIEADSFSERFFPVYQELQDHLRDLKNELDLISAKYEGFKQWYSFGQAIDIEFREVDRLGQSPILTPPAASPQQIEAPAPKEVAEQSLPTSASPFVTPTQPDIGTSSNKTETRSLWQRLFSRNL
ncbi:MAG: 50S ribosome-binding GTPase [Proteobacteria bacterium]|nr:50S ribosome-binding GTPase [Pseudomonadota bacterium]